MLHVVRAMRVLVVLVALVAAVLPVSVSAAPKASIVMDMRNGKVLYSRSADRRVHPASLTKMMTLYLTFEAIRDGRLRLDQKVRVSRHAARQPASKLYLRAGQRVTIRSLIRATAIKSANDAAMVLAEAVSGSQSRFGKLMTRKARALGMKNSQFRNPHGLTKTGHYSTARDMAILARHLFHDFPKYWNVFGRREAYAAGKRIWNTNRLLRTYAGADGLKTGYTRAAGYNLAATAKRGSKHIIAVQLGASSSTDRSRRVTRLLDLGFKEAKSRVAPARPRGARRAPLLVSKSPVPRRKPGRPATGLTAVAEALAPAQAQASTAVVRRAAASPQAESVISSSRLAPAQSAIPRARTSSKRFAAKTPRQAVPTDRGGVPIPKPRPVRLARQGQLSWSAEIGPFQTESDALVQLSQLPETEAALLSKSPVEATGFVYTILMPLVDRMAGERLCAGQVAAEATCRIVRSGGDR